MSSPISNFPNGITSFGIPIIGGGSIPISLNANYYFVDGKHGSDSYDGLSATNAFATIGQANTACRARVNWANTRWAVNDVIVIAPGVYTENLTTMSHGCVYYGLGWDNRDGQFGVKFKPASGAPVDVGSLINSAFFNIGFETAETDASDRVFDSTITNNCLFQNCWFSGPAETATAVGFYASDCTRTKFINCEFTCLDVGMDIVYVDAGDGFNHCLIDGCNFMQIDTAGIRVSANLVGPSSIVTRSNFLGAGQTLGIAVDDNAGGILDVTWCAAESTSGYTNCRSVNASYNNGALVT